MTGNVEKTGDTIGRYLMKHFVEPRLRRSVSFYRAVVVSPASNGRIVVQRPEESETKTLKCSDAAASLQTGDQCVVLVFGAAANAVVIGDGSLSGIGGGGKRYVKSFAVSDWTLSADRYTLTVPGSVHGCGPDLIVQVQMFSGGAYTGAVCSYSIAANGDVTFSAGEAFAGRAVFVGA